MSFRITDHSVSFDQKTTTNANIFLRSMADEIVSIAEPHTPKDKGNLRNDVLKSVLGLSGKVKWHKNYAMYQEKKQFKHYTTPGTGPHYAENAVRQAVERTGNIASRVGLI